MGIALTDIDREVEGIAKAFLARADARGAARRALDSEEESLPPFWTDLVELGWLGLHLDESVGGQGAGLPQLAVVIEQLGQHLAPGPFLPTVLASAILAEAGSEAIGKERLP